MLLRSLRQAVQSPLVENIILDEIGPTQSHSAAFQVVTAWQDIMFLKINETNCDNASKLIDEALERS